MSCWTPPSSAPALDIDHDGYVACLDAFDREVDRLKVTDRIDLIPATEPYYVVRMVEPAELPAPNEC